MSLLKVLTTTTAILFAINSPAKVIASSPKSISISAIDQVVKLVDKQATNGSRKRLSIVVEELGMGTDVSPNTKIYLGYSSSTEMLNLSADFLLSKSVLKFHSAQRVGAGKYKVEVTEYRSYEFESRLVDVTYLINATQMFIDEESRRNSSEDFNGSLLKTSIIVTEEVTEK